MTKHNNFAALLGSAHAAGMAAGNAAKPHAMIVGEPTTLLGNQIDHSKPTYYVPDGVCGFAWITVRPGTSSFARWLVKNGHARKAYRGGVDIWVHQFGQSMERKQAYAYAYAKVLNEAGITAYSESRMD